MGSIGDIYELKVYQQMGGINVSNVLHYQQIVSGANANNLVARWNAELSAAWKQVQSTAVSWLAFECTNLNEPDTDYSYASTSGTGVVTGDYLPPFVAWGFKKTRNTKELRNGSFRVVGVAESAVTNGVANGTIDSDLADLADAMEQPVTLNSTDTFILVIARVTGNLETGYTVVSTGVETVSYQRVTTQNSRKS